MQREIERTVRLFRERLCEKYDGLEMKMLNEMWKVVKKKKSLKKKMNCYNLFTKEQSREIARECPTMSFANRSRETGKRWKTLSTIKKDEYRRRARLHETYQHHDGWDLYMQKSRDYLLHIAKNWFEDEPSVRIHDDLSKEELVELLLLHTHVPTSDDSTESPVLSPAENLEALSYTELLARTRETFPGYSDGAFTSKQDLIDLLVGNAVVKKEERIPLEVHPYYYQLLQKSLEALHNLCDKNFAPEVWRDNAADRRALMELLVRHFDHLELDA